MVTSFQKLTFLFLVVPFLVFADQKRILPKPAVVVPALPVVKQVIGNAPLEKLNLGPIKDLTPSRLLRRPLPSGDAIKGGLMGDKLVLLNADKMTGQFVGFEYGKGLIWRHPAVKTPLIFDTASLDRITIKGQDMPENVKRHACNVALVNGDELLGDLVTLDSGTEKEPGALVLDTWYAGRIRIPFNVLKTISPGTGGSTVIFEGPESAEGWSTGNRAAAQAAGMNLAIPQRGAPQQFRGRPNIPGGIAPGQNDPGDRALAIAGRMKLTAGATRWRYSNNAFYSRGSGALIGRNFELPKKANIEFEMSWQGYFSMGMNFYADKFSQYAGNGYSLRIDSSTAYMYRMSNGGSTKMGQVRSGLQNPQTRANISLRVDKDAKLIILLINGKKIGQWKEAASRAFVGNGKGLVFYTRNTQPMRIRNIRISVWDGRLPDGNNVTSGTGKEDFVLFGNEDSISGQLLAIKDGKLQLKASFGKLDVPMARVSRIDMKQRSTTFDAASSRATLSDIGRLTLTLKKWSENGVDVISPAFGKATISPSAFNVIDFNIGKARMSGENDDPFFP